MNEWNQKRKMIRRYDLTAKIYNARYAEEQELKYAKALAQLSITRSLDVLDVGCGTGLLFKHVAAKAKTTVGVDASRRLLAQAKESAGDFPNVHLIRADADHLPFKDGCFGLVFAFTVLQNMPKPLETVNEVKRVAKPDASLVVTGLKKAFSLDAFKNLLQRACLRLVSLEDVDALKCYVAVAVQE